MKAAVIDYRMGNLASVAKALEAAGMDPFVSSDKDSLAAGDLLVLPGVGNFAAGAKNLKEAGLWSFVLDSAQQGRALLGICLGMQLLFDRSEEGNSEGLGLLSGEVVRIPSAVKVPHMGWNQIVSDRSQVFEGFSGRSFYFVHSYICLASLEDTVATTDYGLEFAAGVQRGRICGVQFHPEKSSTDGIALLHRIKEVFQ